MISIPIGHVDKIIAARKTAIDDHKAYVYAALSDLCNGPLDQRQQEYIAMLFSHLDEIITAHPDQLAIMQAEFEAKIGAAELAKGYVKFRDKLLKLLDYSGLRSTFYPEYFHALGIKSCVYCNSILAITVERRKSKKGKRYRAKFQADHYHSKTGSPCLSISLYNLYPVCANCNLAKGIKKVSFKLYDQVPKHTSPFTFALKGASQAKFILKRDIKLIDIGFTEPSAAPGFETFDTVFDIQGIYKTQVDIAEELLLKAEAYTDTYKAILRHRFKKIFVNDEVINRLLIGNYANSADTHKRPLAKFTRDIAIDIGLIPKDTP
ncbi:hypothetical protein ACFGVS_03235 [Mucilaginibacter sp. AW1-7]|uniref:hypothetical protein n=1 Tax=Mucilaginibacter sp. AW1-7 TaxID=3349874 RepID=UPI003F73DE6C